MASLANSDSQSCARATVRPLQYKFLTTAPGCRRMVNVNITLLIEFGTYISGCVKQLLQHFRVHCVKNNLKYLPDVPVQCVVNNEVGSGSMFPQNLGG